MKVYVLTYLYRNNWDFPERVQCMCKQIWEVEVYATREAAEEAKGAHMFAKILEKEIF
jgi:hypothetical protein